MLAFLRGVGEDQKPFTFQISKFQTMKTKTLHQSVLLNATPHEVYEALMDSRKHAKFTDGKASISRKVGGKFSTFDGYAEGKNLELVPDEKIVQTWRAADWPDGHYSTITFKLTKIESGTKLDFTQIGVPEDQYEDISQGWRDFYWKSMKAFFKK